MDTRRYAEAVMRAEAEAARLANIAAYDRHIRELMLAHKDRERRPLRKAWNR